MKIVKRNPYISIIKKSIKEQVYNELQRDYGFPNAICRSLSEMFERYFDLYLGENINEGQIRYRAVSANVPPGVKIEDMHIVTVKLTLYSRIDLEYAAKSQHEVLKNRIVRITNEAMDQGALLTQADLSILLGESVRTIERYIKELKDEGIIVPTRGNRRDIGPGISHKTKIVELYIKGYEITKIKQLTRHSTEAILRYLKEFSRIMVLYEDNYKLHEVRIITGNSERLVKEYINLYEEYKEKDEHKEILDELRGIYREKSYNQKNKEKWSL